MPSEVRARALAYIAEHHVMTLATRGDDGVWAAAVFYVAVNFDLYFLSSPSTRHARHFLVQPRVAATIHENYKDWRTIQGIQLEGEVTALSGTERDIAILQYKERFPFIATAGDLATALEKVSWFQLRPNRLFFIDNSRGFGRRDEVELP